MCVVHIYTTVDLWCEESPVWILANSSNRSSNFSVEYQYTDGAIFNLFMVTSSNGNIFRVTGHLCGEFTGPGEFPTQTPVTRHFDVFFDLCLNKRLSKQSRGWWFETQSYPLWRQYNVWRKVLMCCINIFYYLFPDARDYFLSAKLLDLNLDLLTTSSVDISINESALSILAIWRNKRHGIKWWWNYPNFGGWGQAM